MSGKFFQKDSGFWPYFLLFMLAAAVYLPIIFSGQTVLIPSYQDITQWIIYREAVARSFAQGYFPLWCEALYSGLDFAGWGHSSAFYPLSFFFFLLPFPEASTWNQFLHLVIGMTGFYFLAGKAGLKKSSAFICASGYGLVAFQTVMFENFLPEMFVSAYSAWVYGFSLELVETRGRRSFLLLSLALGLQWLSGHIEVVVLELLSLLVFILVYVWLRPASAAARLRSLAAWALAIGFGVVLGMATYLPSFAGYSQSFRKLGLSWGLFSFFPEHTIYLETLPSLLLFLSAIFLFCLFMSLKSRTRMFWALSIMLLFTLAEIYNWFNLLWVFYQVPVLNRFIPHGRGLGQALLAFFLLAGMGLDNLSSLEDRGSRRFLLVALLFLEGIYFFIFIRTSYYLSPGAFGQAQEYFQAARRIIFSRWVLCGLGMGTGLLGMALFFSRRLSLKGCVFLVQITLFLEFLATGLALPARNHPGVMVPHPEYLRFLSGINPSQYRVQSVYSFEQWEKVRAPLQTGVLYGTRSPDAYITFSGTRYTEFIGLLDDKAMKYREGKVEDIQILNILKRGDFVSEQKAPLINLLNLKYMIGENKNLKSSSAYFIPYEFYRFGPKTNVEQGRSFKELAAYPPAQFGLKLYLSPGDNFILETGKTGWREKFICQIFFTKEGGEKTVVYQKLMAPGDKLSVSLNQHENSTGNLGFRFLPLDAPAEFKPLTMKARIDNPKKYFKRLEFDELDVFENPGALPRAFLVHGVKLLKEKKPRLDYMGSRDFEPSRTAVLEKELWVRLPEKMAGSSDEAVKIEKDNAFSQDLKLALKNRMPAVLVLSQAYYPGFRAFLDGRETRIVTVDHCFQGIFIAEPGTHKLEIKYQPKSFNLALWTEICGIISWLLVLLAGPVFGKKRAADQPA